MKALLLALLVLGATPALASACGTPTPTATPALRSLFVQDLTGKQVSLADLGHDRPVVVVFLRHFG